MSKVGQVLASSPNNITVELDGYDVFEKQKQAFQVGRFLKVEEGNHDFLVVAIRNVRATREVVQEVVNWRFELECQPVGMLIKGDSDSFRFERGVSRLPVPTEPVHVPDVGLVEAVFTPSGDFDFALGPLAGNANVEVRIDGNRFFGKHSAVVGSTGSGKSCAVARLLQDAVGINNGEYTLAGRQNNSHVVIFDLHSEYASAFRLPDDQQFTLNVLTVDSLKLPYWLLGSEELESMFIESNEANSHNQVSQFKRAVMLNKKRHNPTVGEVTYDTPVYFSIQEVLRYIDNMNREVIGRAVGENSPKRSDGTLIVDRSAVYFDEEVEFVAPSTAKDTKATNGPFHGEFNRFVARLETKLTDERLRFLLSPTKADGSEFGTQDFPDLMKQFLGYMNRSNVSVVDLSGIPFEVLSVTISLVSRLIFDFCFHYSKVMHARGELNDVPVLLVCEEAHNYVPSNNAAAYASSRRSIERIAKEGRKYGLSLMVVSQRPSEVSETIFAQCTNFLALRLTNSADQSYIRRLLPDNVSAVAGELPNLGVGEALIVGDATVLPALLKMRLPDPLPKSQSVMALDEWRELWKTPMFDAVVSRWRGEA